MSRAAAAPVAIIGIGCRFPGAGDPEAFWKLLASGADAITEVPRERWDIDAYYDPDLSRAGTMSTRWGGFLEGIDRFDARFFGISPGEARTMDPQQRLLLEVVWEALESAGIKPSALAGSASAVFVGIGNNDYGRNCLDRPENINAYFASGNALCMSVNRLSHFFNLKGPSLAVDSGCSSSLAALHYACQSLRLGECPLALVAGVNLVLSPQGTIGLSQSWLTAADGRCKSFDESADGYVRSDGCGVAVLKLLDTAIADGDPILAVVRGSAINQDGRSVTFTTPSGEAQMSVMRAALNHAGLDPADISYVEAHGVGSAVMDAVEADSIAKIYGDAHSASSPCLVGSVKTNIGHTEWASGMAALIKVVLALRRGAIPAHLHLRSPIEPLRHDGLRVPAQLHAWEARAQPKRAAVSSFGLGGTNVHAIIEEAPPPNLRDRQAPRIQILPLSAKDPAALSELRERYAAILTATSEPLGDICGTAVNRENFACRSVAVAETAREMAGQLRRPDQTGIHLSNDLAARYLGGEDVDWQALYPAGSYRKVWLPSYPFQRRSYWLEGGSGDVCAPARVPAASQTLTWEDLLARVRSEVAAVVGLDNAAVELSQGFFDMGMRSLGAMELRGRLQTALGSRLAIPSTAVFQYPTPVALARWLAEYLGVAIPANLQSSGRPSERNPSLANEPVAITGIGLRLPSGVNAPDDLWTMLINGVDAVREVPAERWDPDSFYSPDPDVAGRMYTRCGGFLHDVDAFDPQFFGITPREADSLDPQHRLLLETCWEALERAGQAPGDLAGSRTGVFVALGSSGYGDLVADAAGGPSHVDAFAGTGNSASFAAGRISYVLGAHGPCMALDTACSSSLVAIHLACQSLRTGESNLALAGGVNIILKPEGSVLLSRMRALSPDGRCKAFDDSADGYGRGEGCGVVVLQRLSDALASGAPIVAVIRGSAVNHDGRSTGLTAPNGAAQAALLRDALADAGVDATAVGYVEAHGTGTPLGDPVEAAALAEVYLPGRDSRAPLRLGSIKANIAHLESAAGIAGLIKTALALDREEIPGQIHFNRWNPEIPSQTAAMEIPTSRVSWPRASIPRLAGVSSFGMSGTNAHVILQEAPERKPVQTKETRGFDLLCLSAGNPQSLRKTAEQWAAHIACHPEESFEDVCHTSRRGRTHMVCRLAVVAQSSPEAEQRLRSAVSPIDCRRSAAPRIGFLFAGQGEQYSGMGRALLDSEPVFHAAIEECDALLRPHLPESLLAVMYPTNGESRLIDDTLYTQPAIFALGYALSKLWRSWGVEPRAVMGHSLGEYTAACVAGCVSLEDALQLVAERARLMSELPRTGAMAAVLAESSEVSARLAPHWHDVSVAAMNAPRGTVISGDTRKVGMLLEEFESAGIDTRWLRTSHAFHSPLMEPILDALEQEARKVRFSAPRIPLIANLSGERQSTPNPSYWRQHAREAVRFRPSVTAMAGEGIDCFIEMGPHRTLTDLARQCVPEGNCLFIPSLERGAPDHKTILTSLGKVYERGFVVAWDNFGNGMGRRFVALPAYPFRRDRYWVEPQRNEKGANVVSAPVSNLFVDVVD